MKIVGLLLSALGLKKESVLNRGTEVPQSAISVGLDAAPTEPGAEHLREKALSDRASALAERERALEKREKELFAREQAVQEVGNLVEREATIGAEAVVRNAAVAADGHGLPVQAEASHRSENLSSDAEYRRGLELLGRVSGGAGGGEEDLRAAFSCFRRAAQNGHTEATLELALSYARGRGVRKSPVQAHHFFLAAARDGSSRAQHAVGLLMLRGGSIFEKNADQARFWFRKAAEARFAPAVRHLRRHPPPTRPPLPASLPASDQMQGRAAFIALTSLRNISPDDQERFRSMGKKIGATCSRRTMQGKKISSIFDDRSYFEGRATAIAERRGYLDMYSPEGMDGVDGSDPFVLDYRACFVEGVQEGITEFFDDH